MLLRHRPPAISSQAGATHEAYSHLSVKSVAVLRWLQVIRVEHVVVGSVAEAIRAGRPAGGDHSPAGPVAIVPAPYGRNYERLCQGLWAEHARLRVDGEPDTVPVKLTEEKLLRGGRWTLRCGVHDLDVEGHPEGAPSYQELLYEAARFPLGEALSVDVASPEDIELYRGLARTGRPPEIRITRGAAERAGAEAS